MSLGSLRARAGSFFGGRFGSASEAGPEALPVRTGMPGRALHSTAPVRLLGFDQALVWVTVTLLLWGLVMVYSASVAMPDNPKFTRYAHTHFLVRHLLSMMMALVVAVLVFQVPMATAWRPMCTMRRVSQRKSTMATSTPTRPNSSPITAIRKSVWASGNQ